MLKQIPLEETEDFGVIETIMKQYDGFDSSRLFTFDKEIKNDVKKWVIKNKEILGIFNLDYLKLLKIEDYESLEIKEVNSTHKRLSQKEAIAIDVTIDLTFDYKPFSENIEHLTPWTSIIINEDIINNKNIINLVGGIDEFRHLYDDDCYPWYNMRILSKPMVSLLEKIRECYKEAEIKKAIFTKKYPISCIGSQPVLNPHRYRLLVKPFDKLENVLDFMFIQTQLGKIDNSLEPYEEYSSKAYLVKVED